MRRRNHFPRKSRAAKASKRPRTVAVAGDSVQKILTEISNKAFHGAEFQELVDQFCQLCLAHFKASSALYWSATSQGELVLSSACGVTTEYAAGMRAAQSQLAFQAMARDSAVASGKSLASSNDARSGASALAVPVRSVGKTLGVVELLHSSRSAYFDVQKAHQATLLGNAFGTLLEFGRLTHFANQHRRRAHETLPPPDRS